jgi:Type IV secretion system pilin
MATPGTPQAEAASLVQKINEVILFPLIALLSAIAILVFVYGCAIYIMNASNETARATGKKHIMFGIIGLLVMVAAYSILSLAAGTFGLSVPETTIE